MFGGYYEGVMFEVTEEGELVENLSDDQLIPMAMTYRSAAVERGNVFAVAYAEKWEVRVFQKRKWTVL